MRYLLYRQHPTKLGEYHLDTTRYTSARALHRAARRYVNATGVDALLKVLPSTEPDDSDIPMRVIVHGGGDTIYLGGVGATD